MSDQKIVDKVRALFAKTTENGASEEEARTAVELATKIMEKYQLSEEDLAHGPEDDYAKVDAAEMVQTRAWAGMRTYQWEEDLAGFVMSFVSCPCYREHPTMVRKNGIVQMDGDKPKYGKSFVFYGIKEDTMIAAELYDELRRLIAAMAVAKWGGCYKGDGATYAQGFVTGLYAKHGDAKRNEEKQAKLTGSTNALLVIQRRADLVKYKEEKARTWIEKKVGKMSVMGRGGAHGSHEAWTSGRNDGMAADVNAARTRKIGN